MKMESSDGTEGLPWGGAAAGRVLLLVTLCVLFAAGCTTSVTPSPTPQTRTLSGHFALTQEDRVEQTSAGGVVTSCSGTGGYDDISGGATVVVRDEDGTTIGTSHLEVFPLEANEHPLACVYTFEVARLPDVEFYTVEVSHRGEVTFSRADLETDDWSVSITLGG